MDKLHCLLKFLDYWQSLSWVQLLSRTNLGLIKKIKRIYFSILKSLIYDKDHKLKVI